MAAPVQQVPNGTIPIMAGGVPQSAVIYQQPPVVVGGQQQPGGNQLQYNSPRRNFNPRNPNEEQCKIFVGGVGKNTTEETLRAYFRKFGEIADSVIMTDKQTREPRGFAFVTFKNPEAVYAVIEQCNNGGHTLDGKVYLQVRKYFPKAEYDAEKAQAIANQGGNNMFQYKGPMKVSPELKVFVGGIGIGTTEEDVKNYFSSFGKVDAVDMPYHHIYKCPKGFAFVGFENLETVMAVVKDRYHQINGKTVEVKGADEQQAHIHKKRQEEWEFQSPLQPFSRRANLARQHGAKMSPGVQPGTIGTISGYGAYANLAAQPQQVIIPQFAGGQAQYATVQVPAAAAAAGGGYVFDPATNTYYQLPATMLAGASIIGGAAGGNPYGGIQLVQPTVAAGQVLASPQVQARPGQVTADMMAAGLGGAADLPLGQLGAVYPSETSTFGPSRTHILGGGHQPIAGTTVADPHVVYSNAAALSAGESVSSRGFHPYGR